MIDPLRSGVPVIDACVVLYKPDQELLANTLASAVGQPNVRRVRLHVNGDAPLADALISRYQDNVSSGRLVISESENIGFAAGQNTLMRDAFSDGASHALVLNPDLVLAPNAISDLLVASMALGDRHLIGGVLSLRARTGEPHPVDEVIDTTGVVWEPTSRHLDRWQGMRISSVTLGPVELVPGLSGALMLVPLAAWSRVTSVDGDFFDSDFFAYREDAELGIRARALGVGSFVSNRLVGAHYRGTPGTSRANPVTNRLGVRNRFLIAAKWGVAGRPGSMFASILRDAVVIAGVVVRERSSAPGLVEAWRLRGRMRQKRQGLNAAVRRASGARAIEAWSMRASVLRACSRNVDGIAAVVTCVSSPEEALALAKFSGFGAHLVVVIDGQCASEVGDSGTHVSILYTSARVGAAAALNIGAAYALSAGADVVVFLGGEPDQAPAAIRQAEKIAIDLSAAGADGGAVSAVDAAGAWFALGMGRQALARVGLLDESLPVWGIGTELALRLRSCDVPVRIHGSDVTAKDFKSIDRSPVAEDNLSARRGEPASIYYLARNVVLLAKSYPQFLRIGVRSLFRFVPPSMASTSSWRERIRLAISLYRGIADGLLGRRGVDWRDYACGTPVSMPTDGPVLEYGSAGHGVSREEG